MIISSNYINFIKDENKDKFIKSNTFSGKEFDLLNNVDLKDVFDTDKITGFNDIIEFFNINSFVFDISKTYKILFLHEGLINFYFTGFLSNKNILQYNTNNRKFKLIISSFIHSISYKNLDLKTFNEICLKFNNNKKNPNHFNGLKDNYIDLIEFNKFLKSNYLSYDTLNQSHLSLYEVVYY